MTTTQPTTTSLRARISAMDVDDVLTLARDEFASSTVRHYASLMTTMTGRKYVTRTSGEVYKIIRIA